MLQLWVVFFFFDVAMDGPYSRDGVGNIFVVKIECHMGLNRVNSCDM